MNRTFSLLVFALVLIIHSPTLTEAQGIGPIKAACQAMCGDGVLRSRAGWRQALAPRHVNQQCYENCIKEGWNDGYCVAICGGPLLKPKDALAPRDLNQKCYDNCRKRGWPHGGCMALCWSHI